MREQGNKEEHPSWFAHHPTSVLLVLAGLGLAVSLWSLSDVAHHAMRMAAIQDAALLADSLEVVWEIHQETTTRASQLGDEAVLGLASARHFADGLVTKLPGSRVLIYENWQAFVDGQGRDGSTDFLAEASKHRLEKRGEAFSMTETIGDRSQLRYLVALDNAPNASLQQKRAFADISIPLDSGFVIDPNVDINKGLVFFSFLSVLWFGVAGVTLIASRQKTKEIHLEAEKYRSLSEEMKQVVSAERKAAERNDQLLDRIQDAQKFESLSLLSGGLAHDFNNLLVPILANAELLKSELADNSLGCEMVDDINLAANRASSLCRQMLAYSGKAATQHSHLDLNQALQQTTQILSVNVPKSCRLELELGKGLPFVKADPTQIEQVMMNLVTNAAEAIGPRTGSILIRTGTCPLLPEQPHDAAYLSPLSERTEASSAHPESTSEASGVFFEVFDDGIGMTDDTKRKLFDPFYSTKFKGRGLGLAAVLGIVQSHSGSVSVESEFGEFTRIRVTLPVADDLVDKPEADPLPEGTKWANKGKILLADDESAVQGAAMRILNNLGFEVSTADDGEMASRLFALDPQSYTACLFDVTMPGMDGVETLNTVRRVRPDIPILLFSGYTERSAEIEELRDHQTAFMEKPFRRRRLEEKLSGILGRRGEAESGPPA